MTKPVSVKGGTATATATHLLWAGRWIEVVRYADGWIFKNGFDAATWLMEGRSWR